MQDRQDEEAGSWQHDLPLRGTNNTGSKRKKTISHPHMHDLPLRDPDVAGSKSKETISYPHMHGLPLQGPNIAGSKSKQTIRHPHMQTNHAAGKHALVSQSETAALAAGAKRHNPQSISAAQLTGFNEEARAAVDTLMSVGESITFADALRALRMMDGNVTTAKMLLKVTHLPASRVDGRREADPTPATTFSASVKQPASANTFSAPAEQPATHPSTSHVDGRHEADSTPATTFSATVKQPAVKQPAVYVLRLWKLFPARFQNRLHCPLPNGCIELPSTLAAANAEARRVAGMPIRWGDVLTDDKVMKLEKEFDQTLQDLKQGVIVEDEEAEKLSLDKACGPPSTREEIRARAEREIGWVKELHQAESSIHSWWKQKLWVRENGGVKQVSVYEKFRAHGHWYSAFAACSQYEPYFEYELYVLKLEVDGSPSLNQYVPYRVAGR
jgi:hypothetical protein